MNEQLKFSWGHIIAFLALIILSYITFVGVTYKTDGDFTKAAIAMVAIDVVLFVFFLGAQMAKATTRKFAKRIWIERILVFGSPVIFLLCLMPYYHFGTVQSQDEEIVKSFTDAISASKQMFADYDSYSMERISNYDNMLGRVITDKTIHPDEFTCCGFSDGKEEIQRGNMVKALSLQLISENYDSLKTEATKWIESSSDGASTWNVFLLGNTKEIKNAIHDWNYQLREFAKHKMNNEEFNGYNVVKQFEEVSGSLDSVDRGLDGLTTMFTKSAFPPLGSILGAVFLYFALLFPYFLQDRHTKSQFRLIGMEKGASRKSSMSLDTTRPIKKPNRQKQEIIIEPNEEKKSSTPISSSSDDDDDYASFTM
ncbi:hypothetical protein [Xylanibacter ruminicola]|uniref:Uncharacterized protein n=1 Tax=Xylanibacter ruminicola TaxID=839 RepID=A0A1M6VGX3_XYLRU|nr:hypothetical protein [Xylanibacter ruminicola]SHK80718.1 hypothetical protein SAMN05216463_112117 [Xylanibacter ruminicola]